MRSVYQASVAGLAATLLFWMTTKESERPGLSDDEALALCHASDPVTRALDQRVRERQAFDAYRGHVATAIRENALELQEGIALIKDYCQRDYPEFLDRLADAHGPCAVDDGIALLLRQHFE